VARGRENKKSAERQKEDCEGSFELELEIETRSSFRGISSARRDDEAKGRESGAKTIQTAIVAKRSRRDGFRVTAQVHVFLCTSAM